MGMGTWRFGILLHSTICQTKATLIFDVRCGPIVVFERFCAERSQESGVASQVKYNTREVVVYGHRQSKKKNHAAALAARGTSGVAPGTADD